MTFEHVKPGTVDLGQDAQSDGYVVSQALAEAINVALHLNRPLLVTGEPGTGKTTLATAVARALGRELLEFHCKSTSIGRDLLYQFDHLQRLYDAQHQGVAPKPVTSYLALQALGKAIVADSPKVVLVDEIDKAPRDFPNDLLNEIARRRFTVPEVGDDKVYKGSHPPFIVITSKSERQLPLPFLRRCTYFHIEYPNAAELAAIVALHTQGMTLATGLIEAAVARFQDFRDVPGLAKKPATDELIAWTRILHALGVSADTVKSSSLHELPGLATVLKSVEDTKRVRS